MTVVIRKSMDRVTIQKILSSFTKSKGFDAKRHCGVIQLKASPLDIQKQMRDEWE